MPLFSLSLKVQISKSKRYRIAKAKGPSVYNKKYFFKSVEVFYLINFETKNY